MQPAKTLSRLYSTNSVRRLFKFWTRITRTLICVTALTQSVFAQSSASIGGTVTDTTGAVVPGVKIVLQNAQTGVQQITITTSSGTYSIIDVRPGSYDITVTSSGFQGSKTNGVVVGVGQSAVFNFVLSPGTVNESVIVNASTAQVESSTAELGAVVNTTSVSNLPLNGRNFTELLELTPGVSAANVAQTSSNGGGKWGGLAIGSFSYPAVNGQRNRSNMFLLDGVIDLGSLLGNYNYEPVVDDVQEFRVESYNDLAEFGQVSGGIVNVVTKGGSNEFHGSAWDYLRNSAFDATNYFATEVNPLRQNQFGLTFGGPVRIPHVYDGRKRTFFFFTYEGYRQSQTAENLVVTPTTAQLGGDFSGLLASGVVIYNPFSTRSDPNNSGEYLRDAFSNNQIPSSLLSSAALTYANGLFPKPNISRNGYNLLDTTPSTVHMDNFSGRFDQSFGSHDLIFGRVSNYNEPFDGSGGFTGFTEPGVVSGYNVAVHESHTFSPTSILEVYFGRNEGNDTVLSTFPDAPTDFASTLESAGFSSAFLSGFLAQSAPYIPLIGISGYLGNALGTGNANLDDTEIANTWEVGGSFTKVIKRHTIKAGGVYATNNIRRPIAGTSESTSTYQTSNLEQPTSSSGASTGDALASFLLGIPTSAQYRNVSESEHHGQTDGVYVQDQFQINSKLALNIGVRWDVAVWPIYGTLGDGQGYVGTLDLSNGTYLISAVPPACSSTRGAPCIPGGTLPEHVIETPFANRALHQTDFSNWQPRVGIAYHPRNSTSVLAGYARMYDEWNSVAQWSQNAGGNWPSVNELNQDSLNSTTPTVYITNPLSQSSGEIIDPPDTPFSETAYYFDPHFKMPYSDQWDLQIQQELGRVTVLNATYAGSHSTHLDLGGLYNTAEYAAAGDADAVASRRQYPYITPTNYDKSSGNSNYHALELSLKRSEANGLSYLISYTWSKSIDLASSGSFGAEGTLLQNPYDPQADRSVSGFDLTHIFSASATYELPIGHGRALNLPTGWIDSALGGWRTNAVVRLTSGTPYSITVSGDIANTGNTFVQANLVGDPTPTHRSASEWINPSAFESPAADHFGTFGRNALRSQASKDVDFSVFKAFTLFRESSIEFRAEAFNLFNNVVFAAPDNVVGDSTFGAVSSTSNTPRELQFALKYSF